VFDEGSLVLTLAGALPVAAYQVRLICEGAPPRQAFMAALWRSGLLAVLALAALALPVLPLFKSTGQPVVGDVAAALAAVLGFVAAALAVLSFSILFPYTEDFIARANRARERRQAWMGRLDIIAEPRWGFAVLGTALILGTLEGFGIKSLSLAADAVSYFPLTALALLLVFLSAMRDWRLAAAAMLTLALVIGLTLAAWANGMPPLVAFHLLNLGLAWAAGAVPLLVLGASWSRALKQGAEPGPALMLALREDGPTAAAVALIGAVPALVPLFATLPKPMPVAVAACAAPFALFPIFAGLGIALYTLLPRYRSVEEVFGKR
jgi:hypothetical protein